MSIIGYTIGLNTSMYHSIVLSLLPRQFRDAEQMNPRTKHLLWALYWLFFGVALHDYAHQVWQLKGYHNLIEGGYIGFIGMFLLNFAIYIRGKTV